MLEFRWEQETGQIAPSRDPFRAPPISHAPVRPLGAPPGTEHLAGPFCRLVGKRAWRRMVPAIRQRFGRHLRPRESVAYQGHIVETRMSRTGWLIVQLGRLFGAPLPLDAGNAGAAAIVTVTGLPAPPGSDREHGDQFWTRVYARPGTGFPQIIRSLKRFSGRTGLEERVCGGWGVNLATALAVRAERRKLTFVSAGYLVQTGRLRLALPGWMTPGTLSVVHEDLGRGWFAFELRLVHPLAGELLYQRSVFADPADTTRKEDYNG